MAYFLRMWRIILRDLATLSIPNVGVNTDYDAMNGHYISIILLDLYWICSRLSLKNIPYVAL